MVINVLRAQQEIAGLNEQLNETLPKVCNLESFGVSKKWFDVYGNFEAAISFANNCYEVKLPFKSDHGRRYNRFLLCNSRLKNLFNSKFRKDPGLFKRYGEIFEDKTNSNIVERTPESHIVGETC